MSYSDFGLDEKRRAADPARTVKPKWSFDPDYKYKAQAKKAKETGQPIITKTGQTLMF